MLLALAAGSLALSAGVAAADCASLDTDIKAALAASAVDKYDQLFQAMTNEPSCDGTYRSQIGRAMARSALTTLTTDSPPEEIAKVARFGRPWQVLVPLGDAYFAKEDWANAVPIYEEALDDMRDTVANPSAPPKATEERVYKRAIEARALNPVYVATRAFRGKKSGLASPVFRNFTAESVPVPVRFDTASDALTPDGAAAVEDIYAYLENAAPSHVIIIGHTDPRGSDAYNYDLSKRRAASVAAYLTQLGYAGAIEATGMGKSQPFVPDDASKYSEDELYTFDRRVEYKVAE